MEKATVLDARHPDGPVACVRGPADIVA
jgi:hypothetical protein